MGKEANLPCWTPFEQTSQLRWSRSAGCCVLPFPAGLHSTCSKQGRLIIFIDQAAAI